jgi:hypothetical protein
MMQRRHLPEALQKNQQKNTDFYTSNGLHVYFKDPLINDEINVEEVINQMESKIPEHLFSEVEMIIIGWFDEFEKRSLNAFYDSGTIYVSHIQDNNVDLFDDLIHELSHSLETPYGYFLYADNKIHDEFLRKRKYLHDLLWSKGYKAPMTFFTNVEYDEEFDKFLYEKVGYDTLATLVQGVFISPYAPTSLHEYFATGFVEYYLDSNHNFLKKVIPELYKKLQTLQKPEQPDMS